MNNGLYKQIKKYKQKRTRSLLNVNTIILLFFVIAISIGIGYSYFNSNLHITGSVTAYGNFLLTYNITYDLDGGLFYNTPISEYTVETPTFNLPNPVKAGYRFIGWTDGTTESEEVLQNSIQLVVNQTYIAGTQNSNTIYIRGTRGEVMASFVTYEGKPRCMVYIYDESSSTAQFSTNGNSWTTINNWYNVTTKDNVTIYYQFFTLSEGGQNTSSGIPVYNGSFSDFTAAIVETENYVYYNPWTVTQGTEGDINVTALWEEDTTYTITFNSNTGSGTMPTQIISAGETKNLLKNRFIKSEYNFVGWATSNNGTVVYTDEQSITPTSNLTLFAKWEREYTVSFNSNGGTGTMPNQTFVEGVSQSISQNLFTKEGKGFIGWAESSDGPVVYTNGQSISVSNNMTLFAVWGNVYTIAYNNNNGTGTMSNDTVEFGQSITLKTNTFTRNGYVFKGWATSNNATVAEYDDEETITPTSSLTLYAVWKQIFTITFNSNRGTGTMPNQTYIEDEPQTLNANTFTRTGYVFRGWAVSSSATTADYQDEEEITPTSNLTLYAVWKRTFTVRLYRNQRTNDNTYTSITVVEGEEYTLPTNPYTRTGYTLSGWATSRNGTAIYTNGGIINTTENPITATTSLYAKWARN